MKTIAIYLGYEPYPKQGGMERVTDLLARMLSVRFHVILLCKHKNRLGEEYHCPVPLFFLPQDNKEQQAYLLSVLLDNKVDILIDQCEGGVFGRYGIFRHRNELRLPQLKCIAVQHNSAMAMLNNYKIIKHKERLPLCCDWLYKELFLSLLKCRAIRLQKNLSADLNANYDKIVTLSPAFIPHFHLLAPLTPRGKVTAIPNPNTYEEPVTRTSAEKIVLFVGRLDNKAKGIDRLLRVWNKVESKAPGWTLQIVGDGQDKEMLMNMTCRLKLQCVSFEGFRIPKPYYEEASIFCMTSTFEGFGMVLTEAMQHGVVPIAFNSYEALTDIVVDEQDGCLIPAFDEDAYATRLLELMRDKEKLQQISARAIESTSKFSRDKVAQQWYDLLDSMT